MSCMGDTLCASFLLTTTFSKLIHYATISSWKTFFGHTLFHERRDALKTPKDTNPSLVTDVNHSTLDSIYSLLAPPEATVEQLLLERAKANTRLAKALTLTNTFVDPAPQVHADFVRRSRGLLRDVQTSGWTKFREICGAAVRQTLDERSYHVCCSSPSLPPSSTPSADSDKDIPFDHFVQIVVLRTILVGLLNVPSDVEELEHSSLALITSHINDLWTLSKSGIPPPLHVSQELHDHLGRLIPLSTGFHHPINVVVPTWETMWRVCATTLAHACEAQEYQVTFQEFIQKEELSKQDFDSVGDAGFSMKNFVDEAMRLHPPSKHITRLRSPDASGPEGSSNGRGFFDRLRAWFTETKEPNMPPAVAVREAADIQSVLQSQTIWSQDAQVFDPRRYQGTPHNSQQVDSQKKALGLIFGHGPLRCVAAAWAPMAATVICGTILSECAEIGWEISTGPNIGGRQGWDGWRLVAKGLEKL